MADKKVGIPIKCQINKRNSTDESFSRRNGTAFVNAKVSGWNLDFWEHPEKVDPINGQVAPLNCQIYTPDILADDASYTMLESAFLNSAKFQARWDVINKNTITEQSDPQPQQADLFEDQGVQNEIA